MIDLILPPIIIVITAAILVVFLAKVLPSEANGAGSFVLKDAKKSKKTKKKTSSSAFSRFKEKVVKEREKTENVSSGKVALKNVVVGSASVAKKVTQGIVSDRSKGKVVSLRKKSMVSDKIENSEGRNPEELRLMKEIENDPQNSKKYEQLGDYYMEQESFQDARDCYKYVLRLDPRHRRAQVAMKNLDRVLD